MHLSKRPLKRLSVAGANKTISAWRINEAAGQVGLNAVNPGKGRWVVLHLTTITANSTVDPYPITIFFTTIKLML
jgi:hypothetical protein